MSVDADSIIRLGAQLSEERNRAFDLWTWLPSYRAAQAGHGDYAAEHTPTVADVMHEAAIFISHKLNPTPEQMEQCDFYRCPCGVSHDDTENISQN